MDNDLESREIEQRTISLSAAKSRVLTMFGERESGIQEKFVTHLRKYKVGFILVSLLISAIKGSQVLVMRKNIILNKSSQKRFTHCCNYTLGELIKMHN